MRAAACRWVLALGLLVLPGSVLLGAQGLPDPTEMSGVPLPAADLPAGTVSVRVIRGTFANNLPGVTVTFTVDGRTTTARTDESGRAQLEGLAAGAQLVASATVDGQVIESRPVVIGATGYRLVLVAVDPSAAASAAPATAAVPGAVALGPESRVIVDFANEQLNVYYVLHIVNSGSAPVDIGGPFLLDLPREARGAAVLEGASPQATVNGTRLTVTGPFAPGTTLAHVGFGLPSGGATARLEQTWPFPLQGFNVFLLRTGNIDIASPQFVSKQLVAEQGQTIVAGRGPAVAAGESITLEISGLPHYPAWPRYVALALAGITMSVGIWAAVFPGPRRRAA